MPRLSPQGQRQLAEALWADPDLKVYALLDGARVPDLLDRLYGRVRPQFACLLRGKLAPDMARVAPYLVQIERDAEFAQWLAGSGWGNSWGVYALCPLPLRLLLQHLRTLNIVYGPNLESLLFRYYDPRVLRLVAPIFNPEQVRELFGPVACYPCENEAGTGLLLYRHAGGVLQVSERPLALQAQG
jgi:hypothetical protein